VKNALSVIAAGVAAVTDVYDRVSSPAPPVSESPPPSVVSEAKNVSFPPSPVNAEPWSTAVVRITSLAAGVTVTTGVVSVTVSVTVVVVVAGVVAVVVASSDPQAANDRAISDTPPTRAAFAFFFSQTAANFSAVEGCFLEAYVSV
jgi:hypothetical protein